MPTLTVYTPTYNRAHLLPRVYDSLCQQTCKDFLWLVIDDGSADNTHGLVQEWIDQDDSGFEIQYIYKENGGVHTARDLAYKLCETELITGCDSDDWLAEDAIDKILRLWRKEGGVRFAGIFTATKDSNGRSICSVFPQVQYATYQEFTYKYRCIGDKHTVLRTDIISKIPESPAFPGEKLVAEGYKWIQLPEDKPFLLLADPVFIVEYQDAGLSRTAALNRFNNPNGFRASAIQHIVHAKYFKPRFKGYLNYIAFSLILKDRRFVKDSPKPFITALLTPLGLLVYYRFVKEKRLADKL